MSNKMCTPEELKTKLLPYLERWAPECEFLLDETTENKSPGSYHNKRKLITIRYISLIEDFETFQNTEMRISLFEFALIILAHEIGHHLDEKFLSPQQTGEILNKARMLECIPENKESYECYVCTYLKKEFLIEARAWQIARRLLKNHVSKDAFYHVAREGLQAYLESYKYQYIYEMNQFD